jgi:predicted regulator of Ras-like GTPase activity (Roadblock/LC7/MglB family)
MLELADIQKDMERLKKNRDILDHLLKHTGAAGAIVLEATGEPIVEAGALEGDVTSFAQRVATLWKAAQPVSRALGEVSSEELALVGASHNLLLARAGLSHLLAVAYDRETNLGLVRLYTAPAADRLGTLLGSQDLN